MDLLQVNSQSGQPYTEHDDFHVEVVLLDAGFRDNLWTIEQFNQAVVKARSPNDELVVNNRLVLKRGIGAISDGKVALDTNTRRISSLIFSCLISKQILE